jgi:hypothetical protein
MKLRKLLSAVLAAALPLYANSQAMCTSFKVDLLSGGHNFNSTNVARSANTVDTFKAALYLASGSLGAGTTAYSATSEVSGTGYSAGGIAVTNATAPTSSGTTAYWTPSASLVYSTVTLSAFDTVLFYNSFNSNKAVSVHTFGSQSVTAANFTLTMPTNAAGTALLNLA